MIPSEILHFIAKAIGLANNHPDPDAWAAQVVEHGATLVAPSPTTLEAPPALTEQPPTA